MYKPFLEFKILHLFIIILSVVIKYLETHSFLDSLQSGL